MRGNGMDTAGPGFSLVAESGRQARPEIPPPLPHDVGYLAALTGSTIAVLVSHTALAQALEALHVLVARRECPDPLRRHRRPMIGRRPTVIIR